MGTVIGALIIAVIQNGLVLIDIDPFWQFAAVGVVIIVSVLVDQARSARAAPSAPRSAEAVAPPILAVRRVSKHFGGLVALDRVSFELGRARCWRWSATMAPASRP